MSQQIDGKVTTYRATAAIGQYLRVAFSSGNVVVAGATTRDIGTTVEQTFEANQLVGVEFYTKEGSKKFVAAGNITQGAIVYTAADGKVSATQATGAFACGIALTAGAADKIIEVQPILGLVAGT